VVLMSVELNHTIVYAHDKKASAEFLAGILGLEVDSPFGPFIGVTTGNGVTLDFADWEPEFQTQHYAFLISEDEFDQIFGRIKEAGAKYYADPGHTRPGEINHGYGGRGVYFEDPNGHNMEVLTRPYGSDPES
jgi:catechol 2,3-dioxygenase-like lactoylglutathione lyase family enzyme